MSGYADIEQAQPPGPQPPQPPPAPATADIWPSLPLEKAANTESCRRDSLPQSGHGAASSIWLIGRSRSNRLSQIAQLYS